ncbi:MAG: hypothetical protein MUE94_12080 [Verrucomicrobia bacterium]|nr:hypothetical protein [Verrucomicrobiota bacterium]
MPLPNRYAGKFAYLGQYFDKAYKAKPDGTRSTNETGFLSPYGQFLPTEPGRTFLTTLPDGVSTNVGECTVQVISLNVDANHDGSQATAGEAGRSGGEDRLEGFRTPSGLSKRLVEPTCSHA